MTTNKSKNDNASNKTAENNYNNESEEGACTTDDECKVKIITNNKRNKLQSLDIIALINKAIKFLKNKKYI